MHFHGSHTLGALKQLDVAELTGRQQPRSHLGLTNDAPGWAQTGRK